MKLSPNWQFWNTKHQLRLYLSQVAGDVPYHRFKYQSLFILLLNTLQNALIVTLPLTTFQRLLLSDVCLYFHLDQQQNWIFLFFSMESIVCCLQMYRPANGALYLVKSILYDNDKTANRFFVQSTVVHQRGSSRRSLELVRAYMQKYLYCVWYFLAFEILLAAFYRFSSLYHIALNAKYLLTTFDGLLSLLTILATQTIVDAFVLTYGTVHMVFSIIYVAFTIICFLQLGQINALLGKSKPNVFTFTRHHTSMIALVFQFNNFSGSILFAFMAAQVPVNTYLTLKVVLGQFDTTTNMVFLHFIGMQFLVMIGFHYLATKYCIKLHACTKQLFAWSSQMNRRISLAARLRIDVYLGKFEVKKKYGITYGVLGLMCFASFIKCICLYAEIIIYMYRLIQN